MKIWTIYLIWQNDYENPNFPNMEDYFVQCVPDLEKVHEGPRHVIFLYAFTNDKELLKRFLELHDRKCFLVTNKKIDSDDYNSFSMEEDKYELFWFNGKNRDISYSIPMTTWELDRIRELEADIGSNLYELAQYQPHVFNDEIINALDRIHYILFHDTQGPEAEFYYDDDRYSGDYDYVFNYMQAYIDVFKIILEGNE